MNAITSESGLQHQPQPRRRSLTIGAVTVAVAIAAVLYAVLKSQHPDSSQVSSLPYVAGAALFVGIVVFAWLAPMRIAKGGTGLPFAIISVPLIAAFWSSLSLVVAMGAVTVALAYRDGAGPKRGRALAALVIGGLVSVVTLGAILIG